MFKNDPEAALALKNGNMKALEYFYNTYQTALRLFLKAYCGDEALAEEMTQEAFIRLWEQKHRINEQLSVKNFLYTIAKNKATDQLRKSRNQTKILQLQYTPDAEERSSTLDRVILADYNRMLSAALSQLPARNREVFALSRTSNMSNGEISKTLNISVKAVEKHITKTLHFLRIVLKKHQILGLLVFYYLFF